MAQKHLLRDSLFIYLPPLVWMGVIWQTSAIEGSGMNFERVIAFDKVLHIIAYFALCGLIARAAELQIGCNP